MENLESLLLSAMEEKASDIHFEPYEKVFRIRFRIDGILEEIKTLPIELAPKISAQLKIMAKLDVAESRLPQDGRFNLNKKNLRVSTMPTLFGEKVAVRVLESFHQALNINTLGFSENQHKLFLEKIQKPSGLILVTGPTGSGKTLTLYSALNFLNKTNKNINTCEDPIEMQLPGINQVAIHPKAGITFDKILRTFLRQDPDIIMIGEIRDLETAKIAVQASLTGHLVFSTLHTKSASEAIVRLKNMGIPEYLLTNAISLIIAQRLVRKNSSTGFKGRTGIFEILDNPDTPYTTLLESGLEKVKQNITTIEEIYRVCA